MALVVLWMAVVLTASTHSLARCARRHGWCLPRRSTTLPPPDINNADDMESLALLRLGRQLKEKEKTTGIAMPETQVFSISYSKNSQGTLPLIFLFFDCSLRQNHPNL